MEPTINIISQTPNAQKMALHERVKARLGRHATGTTNLLAIVGLVAVLIIFLIGAAFTAKYASVAVGKVGTAAVTLSTKFFPQEEISPSVSNEKILSGIPFTVSWNKKNIAVNGSHSLYYPCVEGLYLKAQTVDSGTQSVLCNKNFDFNNYDNKLTLVASSTKFHTVDLPISIRFTKNGETNSSIAGVINISIVNDAIKELSTTTETTKDVTVKQDVPKTTTTTGGSYTVTTPSTPGQKTENTYVLGNGNVSGTVNNVNGRPDLRPVITDVGYLDSNNNFISSSQPARSNRIAVKFKIENIGDKTSGTFRFNSYPPISPSQTFNSDEQMGITPGGKTEYTLGFDRAIPGNQVFRVSVDPAGNLTNETSRSNNEASITINIQ